MTSTPACQLYLISPPAIILSEFAPRLQEALDAAKGGAFQLRLKDAEDMDILFAADTLLPICRQHGVAFILNDRPDLAKTCGADGVHLGQDDLKTWPVSKTREVLGADAVIGVSAHASRHLAIEAGEQGADYVAFGAFYPTQSKPQEKIDKWGVPKPEIIEWWSEVTILPCVAIGGMTPENCLPLVRAGADFIAAITAIWSHPQGPGAAVAAFNAVIASAREAIGKS